ncbi:uncharacterized protein [Ambystoma mexicanum]|uniref:uncharacterized protein n=1 Tax=Ambystoma mexicanum TaxID=8296 RepID=UPI0037E7E618
MDLRGLNKLLRKDKFKMVTLSQVLQALRLQDWLVSLDLKDAYFHVPIHPKHKKYVRFAVGDSHFVSGPAVRIDLRPEGFHQAHGDGGGSASQARGDSRLPLPGRLVDQGELSRASPGSSVRHLPLPSQAGLLPQFKEVSFEANTAAPVHRSSARHFPGAVFSSPGEGSSHSADGAQVSACPDAPSVRVLEVARSHGILHSSGARGSPADEIFAVGTQDAMVAVLRQDVGPGSGAAFGRLGPSVVGRQRQLDEGGSLLASLAGGDDRDGCIPHGMGSSCQRTDSQRSLVSVGVQTPYQSVGAEGRQASPEGFSADCVRKECPDPDGQHSGHALPQQKGGGAGSLPLCRKAMQLEFWAIQQEVSISAVHLAGDENVTVDALSRQSTISHEWELAQEILLEIFALWWTPQVDLFASSVNRKCERFCSWEFPPKGALGDAFVVEWSFPLLYAFPPVPVIPQVLRRLQKFGSRMILIAPAWARRTWYPDLLDLSICPPRRLPYRDDLLSREGGQVLHPEVRSLNLHAWLLKG